MGSVMNTVTNYCHRLSMEVGQIAAGLDGTGWALISGALLVCGWLFLKGNKIKST